MQLTKLNKTITTIQLTPLTRLRWFVSIFALLFLSFSMMGCVTINDPEASQEYNSDPVGVVDSQTIVGQSLTSRRPDLNGITLWITPLSDQQNLQVSPQQNSLIFKLYKSHDDQLPLYTTSILIPTSGNNIPITIQIPDQNNPLGTNFFIQLTTYSGKIQINGRDEDAYPYGEVFINDQSHEADISFRLSYRYGFTALVQDLKLGMHYAWLILPLLAVLWMPGWLLLEYSGLRRRFDFGEQAALSVGISLSLIPVIMLWTTILKIRWTGIAVLITAIILAILFLGHLIHRRMVGKNIPHNNDPDVEQTPASNNSFCKRFAVSFLLTVIFLVTLTIRLIMIRDLATPAWVDSVHHAMITRQILNLGAYPSTYAPYWDMNPAEYHAGFHSITATFTWLSKLSIEQSLLILGQVLNALAVFSVYLFTKVLTHSPIAGLFASLITGFLTPMPAYYTSWGRYTELTGLLILPAAFALLWLLVRGCITRHKHWIVLLGAILLGGLFLVHYRVSVFLACLMVSYLAIDWIRRRNSPRNISWYLLILSGLLAIFLVFPWMVQTIKSAVLPILKSTTNNTNTFFQDFSWAYLTAAFGKQTLVLAGLGIIWGMIKRNFLCFLLLLWLALLFLVANLDVIHLPGGGLISNLSVEIMLFIPISILGGFFIDQTITCWKDLIPKKLLMPSVGIVIIVSMLVIYTGSKQLISILNPITILSRKADLVAIDWISKNIPEDETIMINPFLWGYGLYAGSDGGYWISPLTGRATLPPPVLYAMGSDRKRIIEVSQKVIELSPNPTVLWEYLTANDIHYIYSGVKDGVLSPATFSSSDHFSILYQKDGVSIFRIEPVRPKPVGKR